MPVSSRPSLAGSDRRGHEERADTVDGVVEVGDGDLGGPLRGEEDERHPHHGFARRLRHGEGVGGPLGGVPRHPLDRGRRVRTSPAVL